MDLQVFKESALSLASIDETQSAILNVNYRYQTDTCRGHILAMASQQRLALQGQRVWPSIQCS